MKLLKQVKTLALYGKCDEEIISINKEDIKELSNKDLKILHDIMLGPHVGLALVVLQNSGFFDLFIPEIRDSLELKSSKKFKEIWPHTIRVVSQTPAKLNLRWAALFHDLGKAQAFSIIDDKVTFYHHEKISAKIFNVFTKKVHIFSPGQRSCIYFLISNLGYAEGYDHDWTDSAVRRFAKETNIYLDDLLILSESDITTQNLKNKQKIIKRIKELKERIKLIKERDAKVPNLPKGIGNEISLQLNIPIGPKIGIIRNILEDKILKGEILPKESFDYYIKYLKNNLTILDITNI